MISDDREQLARPAHAGEDATGSSSSSGLDPVDTPTVDVGAAARRTWLRAIVPPVALFVVVVGIWELAVRGGLVSSYILPTPSAIVIELADLVTGTMLWGHAGITLYETVAGFVLGSAGAFVLAMLSGLSPTVRSMIHPYMVALQVTPRVAIAPIIIAWLGFGPQPKVVLAATICFFPVYINTLTGILAVDADQQEMFRSIRASRWSTFRHLLLPSTLPITFAGLKTAMTLALIGAIVGEFVSAQEGLGLLVQQFSFSLNMAAAFAVLIFLTFLGLALFFVMELLDRWLVYWMHDERLVARTAAFNRRASADPTGSGAPDSRGSTPTRPTTKE